MPLLHQSFLFWNLILKFTQSLVCLIKMFSYLHFYLNHLVLKQFSKPLNSPIHLYYNRLKSNLSIPNHLTYVSLHPICRKTHTLTQLSPQPLHIPLHLSHLRIILLIYILNQTLMLLKIYLWLILQTLIYFLQLLSKIIQVITYFTDWTLMLLELCYDVVITKIDLL